MSVLRGLLPVVAVVPVASGANRPARRAAPLHAQPRVAAANPPPDSANSVRLVTAARTYTRELEKREGKAEEDALAVAAFGRAGASELSEVQREYMDKVQRRLQEKAEELEASRREANEAFAEGQWLYERGRYSAAVAALEAAVRETGQQTVLGGEVSLWLALAYDAAGQRTECISLYKLLEDTHSSREIRKQAYELRFILEAPKLELSPDERVSIPLPEEASAFSDKWSRARSPRAKPVARNWEDEWLENYKPPEVASNRFVLAATSVLCFSLAVYSAWHIRH